MDGAPEGEESTLRPLHSPWTSSIVAGGAQTSRRYIGGPPTPTIAGAVCHPVVAGPWWESQIDINSYGPQEVGSGSPEEQVGQFVDFAKGLIRLDRGSEPEMVLYFAFPDLAGALIRATNSFLVDYFCWSLKHQRILFAKNSRCLTRPKPLYTPC